MRMSEWMEGRPYAELSRRGLDHGVAVARFYEASAKPISTTRLARRLSAATDGAVSVAELMGLSEAEARISRRKKARAA